jgi:hypothetical protein
MLETVKVKAENEDGYLIINKADFNNKDQKLFVDEDGDGKEDKKARKPKEPVKPLES